MAILDEPEVTSVQDRVKGFKAALKANCPGVTIVADVDAGGQRTKADSSMTDILQSNPNVEGRLRHQRRLRARRAQLDSRGGLNGKIAIVGYDATPEARAAIKAGDMYGDAIQYPDKIGALTIDTIHDAFAGKKTPAVVHVNVGSFTKADAQKAQQ